MNIHDLPWAEAEKILSSLTLKQKIGQMVIASIEVTCMDDRTRAFLKENAIGNVILFGKNCASRHQIAALNAEIQDVITETTGLQALISIDQEGGRVTRIRKGATVFPSAMAIGATGDPDNAFLTGYIMGREMKALGIYHDFAPVFDLNFDEETPIFSNRSYAIDPHEDAVYSGAMARGLRAAGILDCGKHFPGRGHGHGDTHFDFVVHRDSLEDIREKYLVPFRSAMKDGMCSLMTSHSCYPALDDRCIPNTVSDRVLQGLARKEMGFEGLIISDDVLMAAVEKKYGAPQGAVLSAQAGCDMVIIGNGGDNADPDGLDVQPPIVQRMLEAAHSGELSMERIHDSVRRIIAVKLALGDMRPMQHVERQDWSAHEAFAQALSRQTVRIARDSVHMLPLPEGTLFLSRRSFARLGVEEGDVLFDSFAPLAASLLGGNAVEFDVSPDLEALKPLIQRAPAVVFSVTSEDECLRLKASMQTICAWNPRFCMVCLDSPHILSHVPFVPCAVYSYDQTLHAVQSVCALLKNKEGVL